MSDLTHQEIEEIVEATVYKTLSNMGIDLSTPEARLDFIEDQLYTRAWRKSIQKGAKVGLMTMITVAVTGALGVFWMGLVYAIGGGHPTP